MFDICLGFYLMLILMTNNFSLIFLGDVVLKDLKLKAEALNSLKLPVTVKAGFIGTITLKVLKFTRLRICVFDFFVQ